MIEPTETEPREAVEALAGALVAIAEEAATDPEPLHAAPQASPIGRLDEAEAARRPVLRWHGHSEAGEAAGTRVADPATEPRGV